MNKSELRNIVDLQWSGASSENRIKVLQSTRKLVPKELLDYFDGLFDSKISNIEDDNEAIVVLLVHGIHTDGGWQELARNEFRAIPNINSIPVGYEFFNGAQLFSPFRNDPIERVEREYRDAVAMNPNSKLVVVAHSFGTYIVSKLLSKYARVKFDRILFCGSIVPRGFRWDIFAGNLDSTSIVNEVGTKDFWPIAATMVSLGYGASGRIGFKAARVTDRYFNLDHSDFFTPEHIREYWLPFVSEGKITASDWDAKRQKSSLIINLLSNSIQAKFAIAIAICFGYVVASNISKIINFICNRLSFY